MTTKEESKTYKMAARIVAILFFVATATYLTGSTLIDEIIQAPGYLLQVYPNRMQVITGVLLEFVDTAAVVGIGIVMYPILKKHSEVVAMSYVATRVLECVFLVIGGIGSLLLIPLSQEVIAAGASEVSNFQASGALLIALSQLGFQIAMVTLGLGSLMFCYVLYSARLIPRFLAVWGFIGYTALFIGAVLEVLGFEYLLTFAIPGGLWEIVVPLWLIIKGFNSLTVDSETAKTDINVRDKMHLSRA